MPSITTTYHVWAEHTGGASVDHNCTVGNFSDPTDHWSVEVIAENEEQAAQLGLRELAKVVAEAQPCQCTRRLQAGSDRWWQSVCVIASHAPYPNYIGDATDE